ncbi:MAG: hypothetical protein AVDCRST_MAG61-2349 [uncultured Friedmanniella sp.]|uniref:DUF3093 domain-containing protein n=1 Tax=uncultured Friedmanniella sp. TaxID=335381 RepID=A0A6J4L3X4_9ACTN|nr:DUF3093 domain-containing protein [uncultured Friedmanniella sp.]CAA9321611.1 MAG: hypothetical protein AVDCRST_MAG61-2349 [uncultured Friedmanniella sp.]
MLFRERLHVPVLWWVLAVLFALSMLAAVGLYLGPVWGVAVFAATLAVAAGMFLAAAVAIEVDDRELRVGRAVIERPWIESCLALDAPAAEVRAGVQADARAHLVLRPYIATAVEVVLRDPADPVPYWLVSTRRPARLAAALAGQTEAAR